MKPPDIIIKSFKNRGLSNLISVQLQTYAHSFAPLITPQTRVSPLNWPLSNDRSFIFSRAIDKESTLPLPQSHLQHYLLSPRQQPSSKPSRPTSVPNDGKLIESGSTPAPLSQNRGKCPGASGTRPDGYTLCNSGFATGSIAWPLPSSQPSGGTGVNQSIPPPIGTVKGSPVFLIDSSIFSSRSFVTFFRWRGDMISVPL